MIQLNDTTKQALRFAAVGALLHNLGKINSKFLDKQVSKASNDYLYQHILGLIGPYVNDIPSEWQNEYSTLRLDASDVLNRTTVAALKTAFNLPTPLNDRTDYTIGDLIEYLGQSEPWYNEFGGQYVIERFFHGGSRLTHLMNRAHRGASGGEKEGIATVCQPVAADLYLSTPFGYETAAPNKNDINELLKKIENVIQVYLKTPADPFSLAEFADKLKPLLGQAIADTRRPLNDVTVGDIGHSGMAFMLTQAVEWILTQRSITHAELTKKKADNTLLWRVLTIHTDSQHYLEEASSLADLRVRQQQVQEAFQNISQQLEETLLAVEIYSDEQRRLFVFPNLDRSTSAYQAIENSVSRFGIDGLCLTSQLSGPVTNHPDDKNRTYIGDQVLVQLQEAPPYDVDADTIATYWPKKAQNKKLCTACNLRSQGYGAEQVDAYKHNPTYYRSKAEGRNICCICMERRTGVAKKWAEKELDKTVWLDEVADSNGRLALIVGQWGLDDFVKRHFYPRANNSLQRDIKWLHTVKFLNSPPPEGYTFTIHGQRYVWQTGQSVLSGEQELLPLRQKNLSIQAPSSLNITIQDVTVAGEQLSLTVQEDLTSAFEVGSQVRCWGQDFRVKSAHLLETLNDAGKQKILSTVFWDTTYPFIIIRSVTKENVSEINQGGEGAKNESFARLRRIWQTTQAFWQTALDEKDAGDNPILPIVSHRLEIITQNRDTLDFGDYHAYDIRLTSSVKLSVVWDPDNKRFITCDNLEYLSKSERLGKPVIEFLKGELTLEEPSGYGSRNKVWGKITVENASLIENSSYVPAIPILAQPRTFMAIVPADRALGVVQSIKTKYEREMGKVRNRLPLHLGVVYFHRRTPLRATLDAGRKMLRYNLGKLKDQVWTVESINQTTSISDSLVTGTQQFNHTVAVTIKNEDGRSLTWYVPAKMGDGQTDDIWYPFVFIQNDVSNRQSIFKAVRPNSDGTTEVCWLVHAAELRAFDRVYFTPATFDFQWMDSSGERFKIAYDTNGNRRNKSLRPYLLDELTTIRQAWDTIAGKDGLTANQIYALRDLIETKRENWQVTTENWELDCQPQASIFWQFCRDAIINANWKNKPIKDEINLLTDWAVSSLLADVIHLYMGVMKQKPQRKENNEQSE